MSSITTNQAPAITFFDLLQDPAIKSRLQPVFVLEQALASRQRARTWPFDPDPRVKQLKQAKEAAKQAFQEKAQLQGPIAAKFLAKTYDNFLSKKFNVEHLFKLACGGLEAFATLPKSPFEGNVAKFDSFSLKSPVNQGPRGITVVQKTERKKTIIFLIVNDLSERMVFSYGFFTKFVCLNKAARHVNTIDMSQLLQIRHTFFCDIHNLNKTLRENLQRIQLTSATLLNKPLNVNVMGILWSYIDDWCINEIIPASPIA